MAPESLLTSYSQEREFAADENILNSTRATDFLTPKSDISTLFRNAVLELARQHPFARPMVNSGRLSVPCVYTESSLNGPDLLDGPVCTRVGTSCVDVQLTTGFLLEKLHEGFTLLCINIDLPADVPDLLTVHGVKISIVTLTSSDDLTGALAKRYLGSAQAALYLIRPDQHITARWPNYDESQLEAALLQAIGKSA